MQAGEKKRVVLLAVMLVILAAIWGFRLFSGGKSTTTGDGGGRTYNRRVVAFPDKPVEVDIGLLDKKMPKYKVSRNIFDPAYKEPVIAPPVVPKKPVIPVQAPSQGPPPPPPPPPKTAAQLREDKAKVEMGKLKFIGFLKRSSRTDVFFALGNNYYVASKGEDITDGYYLKDIGSDSLLIADRESGAEATLEVDFKEGEKGPTVLIPGVGSMSSEETAPPPGRRPGGPPGAQPGGQPASRDRRRPQPPRGGMPPGYGEEDYPPGYTPGGRVSMPAPAALNNRSM